MMAKQPKPAGEPVITDEVRKVSALTADPRNTRRHSEAQISQIVASIERFGFVEKITVTPEGVVIGGHARLEALKRMGRADVECRVIAGLTPSGYKALGLALNRLPENSSWDDDVLRDVLSELDQADEDLSVLGFSDSDLGKLLGEKDALEVKEIETGTVEDEFYISIRGPLADQAKALQALEVAMKPFAAVSVDLGTIAFG
jgi:ParB-like chromosome segregation protein Spo0J